MKPDPQCVWAYSYLRFSDPKQGGGATIDRQDSGLAAWLARNPHVRLDKSLKAWDGRAVSGYTADHRTNPKYVLAQFETRVDAGLVQSGSYLVVENIDRLTREKWIQSVPYVLSLIGKGIRIVQLKPTEIIFDSTMDQGRLFLMLMELGRANSESAMKSERVRDAWDRQRAAAVGGTPHSWAVPAWIERTEEGFRLKTDAARAVRAIFRMCAEGSGHVQILRKLADEYYNPIAGTRWTRSYVSKILSSRTAIGEFQPHLRNGGKHTPVGDPIPNYYPAVVSEAEFHAARRACAARKLHSGRPSSRSGPTSPFAGLLRSALDGSALYVRHWRGRRVLGSQAAADAASAADRAVFPLDHFVDAVLHHLSELSATKLFGDPSAGRVAELRTEMGEITARLDVATARWEADPQSGHWQDQVSKWDREKRRAAAELREAEQQLAHPAAATWTEALRLMKENEPVRLRQCLLETVGAVWAVFVQRDRGVRLAAVQVKFQGGGERGYLIYSKIPQGRACDKEPRRWESFSLADKVPGEFDMADRTHAAALARHLKKLDLTAF